jgi:hypothetical protein
MLLSGIWFKHQIPDKTLGNDSLKVYVRVVPVSKLLISLQTGKLSENFDSIWDLLF